MDENEALIYKTLAINEILILSKRGNTLKYAVNVNGKLEVGEVSWTENI